MKIYSVHDPEFKPCGKVLEGYDTTCLVKAMEAIPLPESGMAYEPSIPALEATCTYGQFQNNAYGGMPVQLGMCWGRNTKLNCLEYHRDSEVNVGTSDFILLLANPDEAIGVKEMFDLADRYGYGGRRISSELKAKGIVNTRTGEPFHYSSIQNILKNVMYMGILRSVETQPRFFPNYKSSHRSSLSGS